MREKSCFSVEKAESYTVCRGMVRQLRQRKAHWGLLFHLDLFVSLLPRGKSSLFSKKHESSQQKAYVPVHITADVLAGVTGQTSAYW